MFCSQCGKELPENSKFCHECGNKLLSSSEIVTENKSKTQIVSKDGQNIEQTTERKGEQRNLGSKNIEPQKQTQTSKFKIIIWSVAIFLIVFLVALSIYDLILFGLGQSTEWVGFLAAITAGIFAGWYYLAEKEKKSKDQSIYTHPKKTIFPNSKAKKNFISGLLVILCIIGVSLIVGLLQSKKNNTTFCESNQCSLNGTCVSKPLNSYCNKISNKGWTCNSGEGYLIEPYMDIVFGNTPICVSLEQLNLACKVKKGANSHLTGLITTDGKYNCY